MNMKLFSMPLMLMLIVLSACSKKSLTELAENENQNSTNGGNGSNNGNNGNGTNTGSGAVYLLNRNTQVNIENGSILKYNSTTENYDLIYDDPQDRKITNGFDNSTGSFRTPGVRHSSETLNGQFLLIGDNQDQNFTHYNLGFFNADQATFTTINLNFINDDVAYSGQYVMLTADDGFNYLINSSSYQVVDDFLGLDGTTESLKTTTSYFPLGKGKFIANSFAQGQPVTNKIIVFNAANSSQIVRTNSDHLVQQVLKYTDNSALILTKNADGDQAIYFYRYSENDLQKIFDAPISSDVILYNENVNLNSSGNYQLLVRNTTQNKHFYYEINQSSGAITLLAEQNATGLTNSLFQCDQYSFGRSNSRSFYHFVETLDQSIYTTCKVSTTQKLLIVFNPTANSIQNYLFTTTYSIGDIFKYKDELYLTTPNGFKTFTVANNTVTYGTENQGLFQSDNLAKCNTLAPSGYDCSQMATIVLSSQTDEQRFNNGGMTMFMYMITDGTTPAAIMSVSDRNGVNYSFLTTKPDLHIGYGKLLSALGLQAEYIELPDDY